MFRLPGTVPKPNSEINLGNVFLKKCGRRILRSRAKCAKKDVSTPKTLVTESIWENNNDNFLDLSKNLSSVVRAFLRDFTVFFEL